MILQVILYMIFINISDIDILIGCLKFRKSKIFNLVEFNPLTGADILARAQIQTWKIPFKTKY